MLRHRYCIGFSALGKTGRGAGAGEGDQWVKSGDGNWEIHGVSFRKCLVHLVSRKLARDLHTYL